MGRKRLYDLDAETRVCRICQRDLPVTKFHANTVRNNYVRIETRCNECQNERRRKAVPSGRVRISRASIVGTNDLSTINRLSKYGLTLDQFNDMYTDQDGKCGICSDALTERYCIDHCHSTGKVRGLLCGNCNTGIGMLRDDPALLTAALSYLS